MSIIRKNNHKIDTALLSVSFILVSIYTLIRSLETLSTAYWIYFPVTILGGIFLYEILYLVNTRQKIFTALSIYIIFGFNFFYIVPLNQVTWDYWPSIPDLSDMTSYTGVWAVLCIIGFVLTVLGYKTTNISQKTNYDSVINPKRIHLPFITGIAFCFICQLIVLYNIGGYSGYIDAYELRLEESIQNYNPYDGFGFLFTFSESLPNLVGIYILLLFKDKSWAKTYKFLLVTVLIVLILNFLFGGLRGSRSTIVWSMFWFVVLYNNVVRVLSVRLIVSSVLFLYIFMSSYSLYKFGGVDGLVGLWDADVKAQIYASKHIEDSEKFGLVRDAGRTDVQAYIIKTYLNEEYPKSYGRTLLAGFVSFIPSFLIPEKPVTAIKEKTGIFWGDYYFSENSYSTLLAGGYGEFVINFGVFWGLIFFYLLGVIIALIDGNIRNTNSLTIFGLISPVLILLSIQLLMSDSNVISQFIFRYLTVPLIVLYFCPRLLKVKFKEN